jgi:hypothetical protein
MSFRFLDFLFALACFAVCALLAAVCLCAKLRALIDRAPAQESCLSASAETVAQSAPKHHRQSSRLAASLASCAALAAFVWIALGSLSASCYVGGACGSGPLGPCALCIFFS